MFALNRAWKEREDRRKIRVAGRMQAGSAWTDVTLLNVSSHGLMVQSASPPARGAYVEIRRQTCVIVGRVVWAKGDTFGIRTQDRIGIQDLLSPAATTAPDGSPALRPSDRRRSTDRHATLKPAQRLERNRQIASAIQFTVLTATGIAAAILLATTVHDTLSAPLKAIEAHLSGET